MCASMIPILSLKGAVLAVQDTTKPHYLSLELTVWGKKHTPGRLSFRGVEVVKEWGEEEGERRAAAFWVVFSRCWVLFFSKLCVCMCVHACVREEGSKN